MPIPPALQVHVFRDATSELDGRTLLAELCRDLAVLAGPCDDEPRRRLVLAALTRAGELECALADAGAPDAARLAGVTDLLAEALVDSRRRVPPRAAARAAAAIIPAKLRGSPPEGFAYYALHPIEFARVAGEVPVGARVAVLGLRSIGTTLGAVAAAAARSRGAAAERITVRPHGHPFNRRATFTQRELAWVQRAIAAGSELWVVDEGPGMSGSSLLGVAEALVDAGASRDRISMLCSRAVDPDALVARDAARRWRAFRSFATGPTTVLPADAGAYVGGGEWRARLYPDESHWPASWPAMERLKFLSHDGRRLLKFEGIGRYGASVLDRAGELSRAGFSPGPRDEGDGFVSYPVVPGTPLVAGDLSETLIDRLAAYAAARASLFACSEASDLAPMVRRNFRLELGEDPPDEPLPIERPVIADGRMMPHEWIGGASDVPLKVDGVSHGDDHFFPGPTDVAWDLAGAILEWRMRPAAARRFLDRYRRASGDDAAKRLPGYLTAYSVFRLAYARMAAESLRGTTEALRLSRDHRRFLAVLRGARRR